MISPKDMLRQVETIVESIPADSLSSNPTPEHPYVVRSKISQKMAYPMGFEILRSHFADSLPWTEARFWFTDHPTTFASDFAEILRSQQPYCIFQVARRGERYLAYLNTPEPAHWEFTTYPVLRELKSAARAALIADAFPRLLHFVTRSPTHALYYNRCEVIFDPVERSCRVEQLHEF